MASLAIRWGSLSHEYQQPLPLRRISNAPVGFQQRGALRVECR